VRLPGVRIGSDPADLVRQSAGGDVGQRDPLQHRAQVAAHRDPDVPQGLGDAGVLDLLGPLAAHVRDRPLDRADHVGECDLGGVLRKPVAAFGAALALHETRVLEVEQDVLEELKRDLLRPGELIAFLGAVARRRCQLRCCAQGVVHFRRDSHGL